MVEWLEKSQYYRVFAKETLQLNYGCDMYVSETQ